jgi:hypothetical protein
MLKSAFEPCIPIKSTTVCPECLHEIKHDGYRLIVQRDGQHVRLMIRNAASEREGTIELSVTGKANRPPLARWALGFNHQSFLGGIGAAVSIRAFHFPSCLT